jgi:hypothetical protein
MLPRFRHFRSKNKTLALLVIVYHSSIILFLCSLALISFAPRVAQVTGLVALVLLVVFLVTGFFRKNLLVDGEDVSAFKMVRRFRGYSVIVISLFLMFSLYVGLNRVGVLPGIYSDELPRAYLKLVDQTSSRGETDSDGKKKYEEFMENYQQFLKHQDMRRQ